jgi:hypothetical protein
MIFSKKKDCAPFRRCLPFQESTRRKRELFSLPLYEVIDGQQISYYAPEAEAIVGGPIIKKGGRNLTQERYQVLEQKRLSEMAGKIKDTPLEKALKIGNGKSVVIEVTDPELSQKGSSG